MRDQNLSVVSIGPIRDSFGERWPGKRDQVWNQVDHFLRRQFRPEDLILRLDETNVLIVQPGQSRMMAQTLAIRAASDLTRFFLGQSSFTDTQVRNVDAIDSDEVVCSPIPRSQIAATLMSQDPTLWTPSAARRMPILTPLGRELTVDISLAPILALQAGRGGLGHVVRTLLTDAVTGEAVNGEQRAQLQSSDLASVDVMVLSTTFARRREGPSPQTQTPLVIPVSYHTLGHASARYAVLQEAHQLTQAERQAFIWEIVDLEPGAPASRIAEVVSIARPHCRGVMCRTEISIDNAQKLKMAGATISSEPRRPVTEAALLRQEGVMAAVSKIIPAIMFHGLSPQLLPVASFIGVTHCTVIADPQA